MQCEPMKTTATAAKSAKSSAGASSAAPAGCMTGSPVSLRRGGLVWPVTPERNGTEATAARGAIGDIDEADGQPRAFEYEPGDEDPGYCTPNGFVAILVCALVGCIFIGSTVAGLLAG